jgi:hypothetical protein
MSSVASTARAARHCVQLSSSPFRFPRRDYIVHYCVEGRSLHKAESVKAPAKPQPLNGDVAHGEPAPGSRGARSDGLDEESEQQ